MTPIRLVIVGATGGSHVGGSFLRAAQQLRVDAILCDTAEAWRMGSIGQKLSWHFRGRRPVALDRFSRRVLETCHRFKATVLLTTGTAPISANLLEECRKIAVRCVNFSTDDPFNPLMRAPWFLRAVQVYDTVFTPRHANMNQLREHGCREVRYLPFGYDPDLFYKTDKSVEMEFDLFFAGHVEASRLEYLSSAISNGLRVRLYGSGWERNRITMPAALGEANIATIRREAAGSKIALCCVRHDNRDGHSMRTFELPAVGACMLVEDTAEHREIFGPEGVRVLYFSSPTQMLGKTRALLAAPAKRTRMRNAVHDWITRGCHTYRDRLKEMLAFAPA